MATKVAPVSTTALAVASRAPRACDVCPSTSAGWYCAADAAYLCDRCDTQVHNANSLARRHERVRLTPAAVQVKSSGGEVTESSKPTKPAHHSHHPPPLVLPVRKRTRSSRVHPHRPPRAHDQGPPIVHVKVEDPNLFADFFDTEDFLIDHPQEVPTLITDLPTSPGSSHEYSPLESSGNSTCFSPESFHAVASPEDSSFASCFKGKAAQDDHVMSGDQFGLVAADGEHGMADELGLVPTGIDIICCDADGNISLAGDACFIPGDIPGLEAFDDCSLSFDLALRGAAEVFEGDRTGTLPSKHLAEADQFATGPFARYFVTQPKSRTSSSSWSTELIKSEAREILRCCTDGQSPSPRPTLRLNYEEIIAAWSDRGEPWVVHPECCHAATDVGLVPDLGLLPAAVAAADGQGDDDDGDDDDEAGSGGREARVLRYKEKRRSRLFAKKIRYEVRKLNAERRPRMKGRFVKRTSIGMS